MLGFSTRYSEVGFEWLSKEREGSIPRSRLSLLFLFNVDKTPAAWSMPAATVFSIS